MKRTPLTLETSELEWWSERDRLYIGLRDTRSDKIVFEAWDEAVQELFDDGFLPDDGFIMGRLINPNGLHEALLKYYLSLKGD